jgi:hypothetical protein
MEGVVSAGCYRLQSRLLSIGSRQVLYLLCILCKVLLIGGTQ